MKDFSSEKLTIEIENKNNEIIMNWIGKNYENEVVPILKKYIEEFIENFNEEDKEKELKINLKKLELLNSSSIPIIITLIVNVEKNKIKTQVIYNSNLEWQESTFTIIKKLAISYKNVSIIGM